MSKFISKKAEQKELLRDFFYCGTIAFLFGGFVGFPLSFLFGNLLFFFLIPVIFVFVWTAPIYYYTCIYYPQRETIEQHSKLQALKDEEYNEQLRLFTPLEEEIDEEMEHDAVPFPANIQRNSVPDSNQVFQQNSASQSPSVSQRNPVVKSDPVTHQVSQTVNTVMNSQNPVNPSSQSVKQTTLQKPQATSNIPLQGQKSNNGRVTF